MQTLAGGAATRVFNRVDVSRASVQWLLHKKEVALAEDGGEPIILGSFLKGEPGRIGSFCCGTRYFSTVDFATSIPSLRNSPTICGDPHTGLA